MDVEKCEMLAGEAGPLAVFVNRGGPDGKRSWQSSDGLGHFLDGLFVFRSDGFDQVSRNGHAGRQGKGLGDRIAQPHRLRPVERCLSRLCEGDDFLHPSTVTSPASPSTRMRTPSAIRSVASRVPTTPGIPYSRATIAECESRPPLSVTIAPSSGRRMLNASVVDSVTRISPLAIRPNSDGPETRPAGPS